MSVLTKSFVVSLLTAAATSVVVYVLMARFDPRFAPRPTATATAVPPAARGSAAGVGPGASPPPGERAAPPAGVGDPAASPVPAPATGRPAAVKKRVDVPRLVGQPIDQAKSILLERGLLVVLSKAQHDDEVPADHVLKQTPLPGSVVSRGTEVSVIVSRGPLPVEVPDVTGMDVDRGREALSADGLRMGKVERKRSEAPKGEIIAMEPIAGERVGRGSTVAVVVSEGPKLHEVPRVIRRTIGSARRTLESAGFVPGRIVWTYDLDYEPGIIVRQDPKGGEMAPAGSEIRLWGSEPE